MQIVDKDILGDFVIDVYDDQYILREVKQIDTSHFLSKGVEGEKEVTHGYFVNLGSLIKKVIHLKLARQEGVITLQQFWQAWVNHNKKIVDLIEGLDLPIKEYKQLPIDENVEV